MTNTMSLINKSNDANANPNDAPFESFLTEFTEKIDAYETCQWKTSNHVHSNLWNDISRLRREIANENNEKNRQLFTEWKYKDSFELTEKNHQNQEQQFKDLPWEESFVLALLYFIYH
jgi:hypothetical protein